MTNKPTLSLSISANQNYQQTQRLITTTHWNEELVKLQRTEDFFANALKFLKKDFFGKFEIFLRKNKNNQPISRLNQAKQTK